MSVEVSETVSSRLKRLGKDMDRNAELGLLFASEHVYSEVSEIIPVDTSTLANSKITPLIVREKASRTAYIGYSAKYAAFVHEMPDTVNFKKAAAKNKFLERTLNQEKNEILRILQRSLRV